MKFSAASLKNADYKKLLINHGEKLVIGVVALLVLLVLWRTNWSRYQGTPEQMSESAEKADQLLAKSQWSPELNKYVLWTVSIEKDLPPTVKPQVDAAQDRLQKQVTDPQELEKLRAEAPKENLLASVNQMFGGVGVSRYIFLTPFHKGIYHRTEPIRLPEQWETVRSLRAVSGRFVLPTVNTSATLEDPMLAGADGQTPGTPKDDENLTEEQRELMARFRITGQLPMGDAMMPAGPGAGHAEAPMPTGRTAQGSRSRESARGGSRGGSRSSNRGSAGPADGGAMAGMAGNEMMAGYMDYVEGGYSGSGATGRGVRYVCVTGVYPFREEFERLNQMMNEPGRSPYELLQLSNFELQRQEARPGVTIWSDRDEDWETVDIQSSVDVLLKEAADFMPDIVPPNYRDVVITSPLPARGMGEWIPEDVSHPEIKAHLDKEQRAMELAMADYLAAEQKAMARQAGGFAGIQSDISGGTRNMMSAMGEEQFIAGMARSMYGSRQGSSSRQVQEMEQMMSREMQGSEMLSTTIDMLLFRYFDFAVDPGRTYRYRVRLTVKNPAFGMDNVRTEEVAQGETRTTPWSAPTKPVSVPRDAQYFLADAKVSQGRGTTASALMDVYQWFADLGTTSKPSAPVKVEPGQFIGNTAKAWVLRPLTPSLEEEDQKFLTGDMLVDVAAAPRTLDGNHPDLQLPSDKRGGLPISDKVAVIDEFGRMVLVDNAAAQKGRDYQEMVLKYQNMGFESIKGAIAEKEKKEEEGGSAIEDIMAMGGDPMGAEGAGGRGGRKKPKKTSLKQRQSAGYGGP